jgi:hypothetical protein
VILDRCRAFDLFASVDAHLCWGVNSNKNKTALGMPETAGTIGKPTAVITSATEETVATAEEARLFWDTSNSSVANNFANQEASKLSSLFKKLS